jgi:hypothetical protein
MERKYNFHEPQQRPLAIKSTWVDRRKQTRC